MQLIGLTGGIGCGKSFLSRHLKTLGIPVVDTDQIARDLLDSGQPALKGIHERFGDAVFLPDGSLDRPALSNIVFNDRDELKWLEGFLHPLIRESWESTVMEWRQQGKDLGVVVIPLLFETSIQDRFDRVVCMACSANTQQGRLEERGWDTSHIEQRLSAQWSLDKKMTSSDHVIWTDTTASGSFLQWDIVQKRILSV